MKNTVKENTTTLRGFPMIKLAVLAAMCGLAMLANAFGEMLQLDLGNAGLAANAAGFTKVQFTSDPMTVPNVAGSSYSLTFTNLGQWSPGTAYLYSDGFYNAGPLTTSVGAGFILTGLPVGYTVAMYADGGWDRGAKVFFGGKTNIIGKYTGASPSISTLSFGGRAVVDVNGQVAGTWIGPGNTDQGQIGGMIFDIEPCQPALTLNGANPMVLPQHSTFTDPGATAVDSCSGASLTVTATGSVDANTLGSYTRTYTAIADGFTNSITRTVNVVVSDYVQLDLGISGSPVPAPAGFTKVARTAANMSIAVSSLGGTACTLAFTNVSGAWNNGNAGSTFEQDGFYVSANQTTTFALKGLTAGSLVTLYGCWGWNGSSAAASITYAGSTTKLTLGTGISAPSSTTLQNVGTAVADANGTVSGTYANGTAEGQVGGMIFEIKAPVSHSVTVLPSGVTNVCGASATFIASAEAGANIQWYNNLNGTITGATNSTLILTNLHPANSGTYKVVASGSGWAATNSVIVSTVDSAPPIMTMNGNSLLVLKVGATYTELGATAFDTCAGSSLTVVTTGSVNTNAAGEYSINYSATTGAGVPASLTRMVIVIDDTVQPDVLLALDFGSAGDLNPAPDGFTKVLGGGNYAGDYSFDVGSGLTLNVTNMGAWSVGTTFSSDGFFNFGHQPALFTLSGLGVGMEATIYAVYGWGGSGQGGRIVYGGVTNRITVGITTTNPPTIADFQFAGMAIAEGGSVNGFWDDSAANVQGQIGGMIISVQSILAHGAAITPASASPQCGSTLTLAATVGGAPPFTYRWYDNHTNLIAGATNATLNLMNVRPANVGTYRVIANNAYGSSTNTATVDGVVDAAPPVITLNGINPVNIVVHGTYTEPGATAFDLCAQSSVTVHTTGVVDTATVGIYTVTYSATTLSSGVSTNLARTVNVVAVPNDTLQLDFAPTTGAIVPAPAGFTKVQNGPQAAYGNYSFPNVAGSAYTLSFTNIASYNFGNTNEPLVTDGFYSHTASFGMSGLPQPAKVTLYAIWAWDGSGRGANVFFGNGNAQIVNNGDPGATPSLTNFTRIGSALVDANGSVTGHWQGPGGTNDEGQLGGMVVVVGTNAPPAASNMALIATNGVPAVLRIIGGASPPTDPDNDPLTVTAVQSPTPHNGAVTTDGINVTYNAGNGFSGQDTFNYTVGDGFGGFALATVTVSVAAANLPPVASNIVMSAVSGVATSLRIIGGASPPTDPNNDPLTVTAVENPTLNASTVTTDGTNVVFTSTNGFAGQDTFTYTVGDGRGGFSMATVTVNVGSGNQPPVANAMLMGAVSTVPATLKIIGGVSGPSDPDGDPLMVTALQSPTPNAGTAVTADGTNVTYTSANGFTGQDTFTYTVGDGRGGFATATVTVDVGTSGAGYNRVSKPTLAGGQGQISYQGIPHASYELDAAANLRTPVWNPVTTNTASASGQVIFNFTAPPAPSFFRTRPAP